MVDLGEYDARRFTPQSDSEFNRICDEHRERVKVLLAENDRFETCNFVEDVE